MITRQECISLLFDLQDSGIDCKKYISEMSLNYEPSLEVLEFLSKHIELNLFKFYTKIRKSYNNGKSKLYINIVNCNDDKNTSNDLLCTLASLQLQLLLFNNELNDSSFLQSARFDSISKALLHYYKEKDIIPVKKLLELIRIDLKILEEINKNNE